MKYANFSNVGGAFVDGEKNSINIGDYMQVIAVDELYKSMGIEYEDIVRIRLSELEGYKGEKLILPINFMVSDMTFCRKDRFMFSEDIIPVFIGICIYRGGFTFSEYNIEYFKEHAPIGCRDAATRNLLKSYGIPCYLSGCVSLTIPFRESSDKYKKVYFTDVPEFVREYVPDEIIKDAEFRHHIVEVNKDEYYDEAYAKKKAEEMLDEYRSNARLVITSRLHCAVPCIAMGIPTLIVREYKGYTFEWIKQFTDVYYEKDLNDVNWERERTDVTILKQKMRNVACKQIQNAWDRYLFYEIEDEYEIYRDAETDYIDSQRMSKEKIHKRLDREFSGGVKQYCIWGISDDAEEIYEYVNRKFPKSKLTRVIDTYRDLTFHGVASEKPNILNKHDDYLTIVTSVNAVNAAKDLFDRIGKDRSEYVFIADTFMDK